MRAITRVVASVSVLLLAAEPASAQWLGQRADGRNTGHVAGAAASAPDRAVLWRLPTGVAGDGASVAAPPGASGVTVVVRNGTVQGYGSDGRLRWTSEPDGYDALSGWLPAPLADSARAVLVHRSSRDLSVFDETGRRVATSARVDPNAGPTAPFTWVLQSPARVISAPASTFSVFAWGDPEASGFSAPLWSRNLAPAAAAFRLLAGEFREAGRTDVLGFDTGTVFVLDPDDGALLARPPAFFTGFGSGFSEALDIDGDGVDEVVVAHTTDTGYARAGVFRPLTGEWVWLLEYLPADRRANLRTTLEALHDVDADGAPELVYSVFDSRAAESGTFPPGPLADLDGLNTADRWATLVLDAATGAVEQRIPDRIFRGLLETDDDVVLALSDTSTGAALVLADLEFLRVFADASPEAVARLEATDLVRAPTPNVAPRHNPRDPTGLVGHGPTVAGVARDEATGIPERYIRLRLGAGAITSEPLFSAAGGEVAPLRAEVDGRSFWIGSGGYQQLDVDLAPLGLPVPGPGRTTPIRIAPYTPGGADPVLATRGVASLVGLATADGSAVPEQTFAVADLFAGSPHGLYVDGALHWATRVTGLDGLESVAVVDAASGDTVRFVLDVPPNVANALVAAEELGLIALTYVDDRRSGNERYRMRLLDPAATTPFVADWPLDFDRAASTPPLAWDDDGAARFAASTFNRIRVYDRDGAVLRAITSEGQNRPLVAEDVDGDGQIDLLAGAAAPTAGAPRRFCAWRVDSGARLWCEDDASAAASPSAVPTVLPQSGAGADVVLSYPFGEVRLLDGATGTVLWRQCLQGGELRDLGATTSGATCESARIAAPATADLDGDGAPEILVGSADGLIYAIAPTGALVRTEVVRGGVSQLAVGDTDGDGTLEVIASLVTGELVALGEPEVSAPQDVLDVAVDPLTGALGTEDIDSTLERDRVGVRWTATGAAAGWRVVVYTAAGVPVAALDAPGESTEALLTRVPLVAGAEYFVAVQAISTTDGTYSAESVSDGFVVEPLDEIVISAFSVSPDEVSAGSSATFVASIRAVGPDDLVRADVSAGGLAEVSTPLTGGPSAAVESTLDLSASDLATPGPIVFSALVTDQRGATASATFVVNVLDRVEPDAGDAGPDAADVGPDAADAGGDIGIDAADAADAAEDTADAALDIDVGGSDVADAGFDGEDSEDGDASDVGDVPDAGGPDADIEVGGGGGSGCSCSSGDSAPGSGGLVIAGVLGLWMLLRRRRTVAFAAA